MFLCVYVCVIVCVFVYLTVHIINNTYCAHHSEWNKRLTAEQARLAFERSSRQEHEFYQLFTSQSLLFYSLVCNIYLSVPLHPSIHPSVCLFILPFHPPPHRHLGCGLSRRGVDQGEASAHQTLGQLLRLGRLKRSSMTSSAPSSSSFSSFLILSYLSSSFSSSSSSSIRSLSVMILVDTTMTSVID